MADRDAPVGIITGGDVLKALAGDPPAWMLVSDAASADLIVTYPDETLHDAALHMARNGVGRLPVVTRGRKHTLVGYLGRGELLSARLAQDQDDHVREPGWLGRDVRR